MANVSRECEQLVVLLDFGDNLQVAECAFDVDLCHVRRSRLLTHTDNEKANQVLAEHKKSSICHPLRACNKEYAVARVRMCIERNASQDDAGRRSVYTVQVSRA